MTKISLGGSRWLYETTARWRAEQKDAKLEVDKQRLGANTKRDAKLQVRDTSSVLDRLHNKQQLDPDRAISSILHGAGLHYYSDWYLSGLSGISGMNYDQAGGGSGAKDGLPRSEMEAHRRQSYQAARDTLGERYLPVVDAVVLQELSVSEVRSEVEYKDKNAASAIVVERLNTGLRRLAVHYGTLRR